MKNTVEYCSFCPRNCKADRNRGILGYCNSENNYSIASICCHKGEEPPISGVNGICNVFFSHCNLQCIYCQNYQISNNSVNNQNFSDLNDVIYNIIELLDNGCKAVGLVSPSHFVMQVKEIIITLKSLGYSPYFVYNTNSYDKLETIKSLEGMIDIYLPDFKYMENDISMQYSGVNDYPEIALKAIIEMYRQKGSNLVSEDKFHASSGLIIRHLVLPGNINNSIRVLNAIAENLSNKVYISLMSQYCPTINVKNHKVLNRLLTSKEYDLVIKEMEKLGFENGWIQELDSNNNYLPDFNKLNPFE